MRREVPGRYTLQGDQVGFELGPYDAARPLVIDPVLVYSTYLGGSGSDSGNDIAVDSRGNAYVVGLTTSANFPTITGSFDRSYNRGGYDVFVTKLNATGARSLYSTYLGGNGFDGGHGIALDRHGNAYVTGSTISANFPTTVGARDRTRNGGNCGFEEFAPCADAFVTKLNATGSKLLYSTYLGGNGFDGGHGIALDRNGNAYVTGDTTSSNFPTTAGAYDRAYTQGGCSIEDAPCPDSFVAKLNATGSKLLYSTYLGGGDYEGFSDIGGADIAVDASGNAYLTGLTASRDFPTTRGAYDRSYNGGSSDVYLTKLNAAGSRLIYSPYLGGRYGDRGEGIAINASGNAYVTGSTEIGGFPTTAGAYDRSFNGSFDAFVTKFNTGGAGLVYSTYIGGSIEDGGHDIALDASGNAYITGRTYSRNFPTTRGAVDRTYNEEGDAFVTRLNATGSRLLYSTFLGGSGNEPDTGNAVAVSPAPDTQQSAATGAYVTGSTGSTNFPTTTGAFDRSYNGGAEGYGGDAFVARIR